MLATITAANDASRPSQIVLALLMVRFPPVARSRLFDAGFGTAARKRVRRH